MLLPTVTHPAGRARAFDDAFKALVRATDEVNDHPTLAYAIDKTHRVVTTDNRALLSQADLAEWDEACDEFDALPQEEKGKWIKKVLSDYPKIDQLPDPDSDNWIH